MSAAIVLAAGAGVAAAGALVELAGAGTRRPRRATSPPARLGALAARLGRAVGVPAAPGGLAARMAAAGLPPRVRPAEVMAVKVGAALLGPLSALPLVTSLAPRPGCALVVGTAAAGFAAPDLWLRRRARARLGRAGRELADVLDLLQVAVAAGLPTGRALGEVARRRRGVLGAELRATSLRIALGVPRAEALGRLRAALPLPEVVALTAAIERSDRHGAPLAPALAALALEARAARAARVREQAAAAAPRIQLAVALLLVPAVLLLVAAVLVHRLG